MSATKNALFASIIVGTLAGQPALANDTATIETSNGIQTLTFQEIEQKDLLNLLSEKDFDRYMDWSLGVVEVENEKQASNRAEIKRQEEIQARENKIQANSRKKQAEYQASIDSNRAETERKNANAEKLRNNTQINRQINALMLVVSGKKGILSNQEMSQALESIANDTKLQLTQQEKNIYLQLAESYKNGGNGPLVVSKKAKNAIRGVAQQILVSDMSSYATAQEEKKIKKDLNTFLQHM